MVVPSDGTLLAASMRAGLAAFSHDVPDVAASVTAGAAGDAAAQSALVDDEVARGVDAILALPVDAASLGAALGRAAAARVVTVTVGAPEAQGARCDIEPWDEATFGRHMVDVMAAWMSYAGAWVPLVDAGKSDAQGRRVDGEMAEARAAYPGLTTGTAPLEAGSREAAHDRVVELLHAHPELKAILANSAATVQGAAQAVTEMGRAGAVGVFGSCFPSEAADGLRDGAVISIQFSVPADAGYAAARAAYQLLASGRIENGMDLGRPGYDRVTVKLNAFHVRVAFGRAWVDVDKGGMRDWINPDGTYKL